MKVFLSDLVHNQVAGDNQISGGRDFVVPLNVARIASYARGCLRDSVELSIFKYPDELLSVLKREKPDILGLSNYIWNRDLNFRIGSFAKELYPNTLTVMGGPSIRTDREGIADFLRRNRYVDVYIVFEGERPFSELVRTFGEEGRKLLERDSGLLGCAYLADGQLVYEPAQPSNSLEELPSPYLNGMLDEFLEKRLIPLFETNRGCPFRCTFCVWGISSLNKVRTFSLEQVYTEMEYVATKFPDLPAWIIADANFGLLKRDVEIAEKMRDIKERTPALRTILTWESLSKNERNIEISRLLGNDVGYVLIAVQTLDPQAQQNIKRKAVKTEDIATRIETLHAAGARVDTHVLSGLPGESYQGHLETLRKCFELGFDHIQAFSTLLLPGSEMETKHSRETFRLRTKYRIRQGSYGEYHGIKSIDCEEIIRATAGISESQVLSLRTVHWLIWYGWNHGFLKPMFQFVHREHGLNPLDMIIEIINRDKRNHPDIANLLSSLREDADSEWFDTENDLREFYVAAEKWEWIMNNGFSKAEFKYNALMILHTGLFNNLLDVFLEIVYSRFRSSHIDEVARMVREMRIEPDYFISGDFVEEKKIPISPQVILYAPGSRWQKNAEQGKSYLLMLKKPAANREKVRVQLMRYGYTKDTLYAIQKTLGVLPDAFLYDACVVEGKQA